MLSLKPIKKFAEIYAKYGKFIGLGAKTMEKIVLHFFDKAAKIEKKLWKNKNYGLIWNTVL